MSMFGSREKAAQGQNIAAAVTEVSERALQLVHEEIELAKAEVGQKVSRLMRGTVVAAAAGAFVLSALMLILIGLSLWAWYVLPVGNTEYFWGFFAVAGALIVLALLAGMIAWRAVRAGSPPVPSMAIDEARKIREAVSATTEAAVSGDSALGVSHGDAGEIPTWGAAEPENAEQSAAAASE